MKRKAVVLDAGPRRIGPVRLPEGQVKVSDRWWYCEVHKRLLYGKRHCQCEHAKPAHKRCCRTSGPYATREQAIESTQPRTADGVTIPTRPEEESAA